MKFEEKPLLTVRIAVLGQTNVGKSALTVRYLTKRYIGEYRSNVDLLYTQVMKIEDKTVKVEIVDVFLKDNDNFPEEIIHWADGCCIVYDISSKISCLFSLQLLEWISKLNLEIPKIIIGNKADLSYRREVTENEGKALAFRYNCNFYDLSVAMNSPDVFTSLDKLINEALAHKKIQQSQRFSFLKIIWALIHTRKPQPIDYSGTLEVCNKSELNRKRRHSFRKIIN